MKIMLSHLEGVKFDSKLLYMGTELEFLYGEKKTTDLGIKLNEDYEEKFEEIDSKIGDIFLYVILQV